MKVEIRLEKTSQPLIFKHIWNTYQKGLMFCVCDHETVHKFPIDHIFDVKESYK